MKHGTARTLERVRWRDGRLWLGVALIIASMLVGSRLLSHSDDRVLVWRATHDLSIGSTPADLEPVAVTLGDAGFGYARANANPVGVLVRPVAAGELLPTSALGNVDDSIRLCCWIDVVPRANEIHMWQNKMCKSPHKCLIYSISHDVF